MALVHQDADNTAVMAPVARSFFKAHTVVTTMLCVLFAIMYLDRVNISAAAAPLKAHFQLTNTQMGLAFSAFSWAYLASVLFGGWGARKYGARASLFVAVSIVGVGTILTGLTGGLGSLFIARLVVGLGEGPAFPAATQAMRNWYPALRIHPRHHAQCVAPGRGDRPAVGRDHYCLVRLASFLHRMRCGRPRLGGGLVVLLSR